LSYTQEGRNIRKVVSSTSEGGIRFHAESFTGGKRKPRVCEPVMVVLKGKEEGVRSVLGRKSGMGYSYAEKKGGKDPDRKGGKF